MNVLFGLFLFFHGLIHAGYLAPKPDDANYPFVLDGWFFSLIGESAKIVGGLLAVVAMLSFVLAGLAVIGVPGLDGVGRSAVATGSVASLALLLLFWHNWLVLGIVIDVVLLLGVFYFKWSFGN